MSSVEAAPPRSEALAGHERLRRRLDFQHCYRRARRHEGEFIRLLVRPNGLDHSRLGITIGRKVGGAVVRHRFKRRIREIYRRWEERTRLAPRDRVVHALPSAGRADFTQLRADLIGLLERAEGEPPERRRGRSSRS